MPQFYICTNPLADLPDGIENFMYHASSPRNFSYIIKMDLKNKRPSAFFTGNSFGFLYLPADGRIELYFIVVADNINKASDARLSAMMRQKAQFYVNQLNDKQNRGKEKQSTWMLLRDYNRCTLGQQVVAFRQQGCFMVCPAMRSLPGYASSKNPIINPHAPTVYFFHPFDTAIRNSGIHF